jgi:hypothetical protein
MVQIRSREEILSTLDEQGCVDGMPFMPEMLRFCGQRFRVSAVAHKTCETARQTWKIRRLRAAVHLEGLRCDGAAHGGCQAECNLFWKDAWLKSADDTGKRPIPPVVDERGRPRGCTEDELIANTLLGSGLPEEEPRYACQATRLYDATEELACSDTRQYLYDVLTRNYSIPHVLRVLWLAFLKRWYPRVPRGYRFAKFIREWMHRWLMGREVPDFQGTIAVGEPTPTGRLDLKPGEMVRVKSKDEIVKTLDEKGRNRGLGFDVEMSPYCGRVFTVRRTVTKIVDELTGKMRHMKEPCITLQGVVCNAEYGECRLMCPRKIPPYWREIWLQRVADPQPSKPTLTA